MEDVAIQFENVGKLYKLGLIGTGSIADDLNRWWQTRILKNEDPYLKIGETNDRSKKGSSNYVWALKDITFDVKQGDVVGIIGKNGAGKSTLLKLLSRVTSPSTGAIRAKGRIASLLEVGTGFHPELTGRENIYMNGSIMGMTRYEISRKLDEIIDFAGVERYIDTPVKRYSSGMTVRLGFAVAAFLEPEILVVDEVLAVGDAEFQKKAIGKMQNVSKGEGRSVLFVSHNMAAIKRLCNKSIILDKGSITFNGETNEAINFYLNLNTVQEKKQIKDFIIHSHKYIKINTIKINNTIYNYTTIKSNQSFFDIEICGILEQNITAEIKMYIKTLDGTPLVSLLEGRYINKTTELKKGEFNFCKRIKIPKYVSEGDFIIDLYLHHPLVQDHFYAPNCCHIHFNGNYSDMGRPLIGRQDGFMGLETINFD